MDKTYSSKDKDFVESIPRRMKDVIVANGRSITIINKVCHSLLLF